MATYMERSQPVKKAIFFGTKRHCKIQGKMSCNGLGNRCSIQSKFQASNRSIMERDARYKWLIFRLDFLGRKSVHAV